MSGETIQLVAGFDRAYALKSFLKQFFSVVRLTIYTDCGSLTTHLQGEAIKYASDTGNKRLNLDIALITEGLERGEIDNIRHVDSESNYADELTKRKQVSESKLEQAATECQISIPYLESVQ